MKWLRSLKFWDKSKQDVSNISGSLRKLSDEEAISLEDCLAQNGLPFDSLEDAEKYFYSVRDNDLEELATVEEKHPELKLDGKAQSLSRLENFYYRVYIDKKIDLDISMERFEELFTQYMRKVFVNCELAEWAVFENDFAEGRYDIGLMYGYGSGGSELYANGLHFNEKESGRNYLYTQFMYYVPKEWEQKVQ